MQVGLIYNWFKYIAKAICIKTQFYDKSFNIAIDCNIKTF